MTLEYPNETPPPSPFINACRKGDMTLINQTTPTSVEELDEGLFVAAKKGHVRSIGAILGMSPTPPGLAKALAAACVSGHIRVASSLALSQNLPETAFAEALLVIAQKKKVGMARSIMRWADGREGGFKDNLLAQFQSIRENPSFQDFCDKFDGKDIPITPDGLDQEEKTPSSPPNEEVSPPPAPIDQIVLSSDDETFNDALRVKIPNHVLERAFLAALSGGREDRALLVAGCGLNPFSKGKILLEACVAAGSSASISALLSLGLKPQGVAVNAFAMAIKQKRYDICSIIERNGFDPSGDTGKWVPEVWELQPEEMDELWRVCPRAKSVYSKQLAKQDSNPIARVAALSPNGQIDFWRLRDEPEFAGLSEDELDAKLDAMALAVISAKQKPVSVEMSDEEIDRRALDKINKQDSKKRQKEMDLDELDRITWERLNSLADDQPQTVPLDDQSFYFGNTEGSFERELDRKPRTKKGFRRK